MKLLVFSCLIVLLAGCVWDRAGVKREFSVSIPAGSPDVQGAVQIIGDVVTPYGLLRQPSSSASEGAPIAEFYRTADMYCRVYLKDQTLTAVLFQYTKGHGSSDFRDMSRSLSDQLSKRYGAKRVTVRN
jgi:hypothetical protein